METRGRKRRVHPGTVYGRLTTTDYAYLVDNFGNYKVAVRCECGVEKEVRLSNLINGGTRSCGCYRIERSTERLKTYGLIPEVVKVG